jgi:hypothetical protein
MHITGTSQLNAVEVIHPSGSLECIAAVGWSTDSSKSGKKMKKIQNKAEKIENQTTDNSSDSSSGTAYEGESDEASDDF